MHRQQRFPITNLRQAKRRAWLLILVLCLGMGWPQPAYAQGEWCAGLGTWSATTKTCTVSGIANVTGWKTIPVGETLLIKSGGVLYNNNNIRPYSDLTF